MQISTTTFSVAVAVLAVGVAAGCASKTTRTAGTATAPVETTTQPVATRLPTTSTIPPNSPPREAPPDIGPAPRVVTAPPPAVAAAPPAAAATAATASAMTGDAAMMTHAAQDGLAEIRLGQLAQQRAGSDAVRQLGQRIVADHTQANAELRQLAQQRGVALPQTLDPQHQAAEQRLAALSGAPFDVAFLEQMIADHARGIAMFERIASTADDPALRSWAAKQLPVLRQHQASTQNLHAQVARGPHAVQPSASPPTTIIVPR